jgi:hypothetical protein
LPRQESGRTWQLQESEGHGADTDYQYPCVILHLFLSSSQDREDKVEQSDVFDLPTIPESMNRLALAYMV